MARPRTRHTLASAVLVLTSTLLALALVETGLRWRGVFDVTAVHAGCHVFSHNPKLMYVLEPGCFDINSAGMRDREFEETSDAFRIAALGDSITYGPNVAAEDTWPKRLERLVAADPSLAPTEVLNFGVQGYSTVPEVETLRVAGLRFGPELVILQYYRNDEEIYTTIFNMILQDLRHRRLGGAADAIDRRHSPFVRWLASTRVVLGLRLVWSQLREPAPPPSSAGQTPEVFEELQRGHIRRYYDDKNPVRLGLEDLRALADEHGLTVLFVVFPERFEDASDYDDAWAAKEAGAMALCRSLGFHCLDLRRRLATTPGLRDLGGDDLFADDCCHLNAGGMEAAAAVIFEELRRLELLPLRSRTSSTTSSRSEN